MASISGTITHAENVDAPDMGPGYSVAKSDELSLNFGIDSTTDRVDCSVTGWFYWTGGLTLPEYTGTINVKVNGTLVDSEEFSIAPAKTTIPNVIYDYKVIESQLQTGSNMVEFYCKLEGGLDGADYWTYRMTVNKT